MAATIFKGSAIRALKQNLDLNGAVSILSGSTDPSSSATSAPIGSLYLNTSNGLVYRKIDAGSSTSWKSLASTDNVSLNYISNPNAEVDTTGWATFADAAASRPVDGTGGAPNSTFTRSTSSPLRSLASFLWTKSAANRQGEGFGYAFSIARADRAKQQQISFSYEIDSGTYSGGTSTTDSDLIVYIYDVTNAVLIEPSNIKLDGAVAGVQNNYSATFQTASNSESYRLIVYTATASASAYTIKFDDFLVGPQVKSLGAPITDTVTFTPTISASTTAPTLGTASVTSGYWIRRGDRMVINYTFRFGSSGASAGSGSYRINLPSGYAIDTAKLSSAAGIAYIGAGIAYDDSASTKVDLDAEYSTTTYFTLRAAGSTGLVGAAVPWTWAVSDYLSIEVEVPIAGWGSSVSLSSGDTQRLVAASYTSTSVATISTAAPADFATKVFDTHSAVTTGASWKFTAPVAGIYHVAASIYSNTASYDICLYKNGVFLRQGGHGTASALSTMSVAVDLVAGDYIDIRSGTSVALSAAATNTYVSIERIPQNQTIASSELIAAKLLLSSAQSIAVATEVVVTFNSKEYDTHGAINTTTNRFVAPAAGYYRVHLSLGSSSVTASTTAYFGAGIRKNGTRVAVNYLYFSGTTGIDPTSTCTTTLYLSAGDYLDFSSEGFEAGATSYSITSSSVATYCTIERCGGN